MRPRRVITLFCPDPTERSVLTVVLDARGYRVRSNSAAVPDLYLIVHALLDAGKTANAFGRAACKESPGVPVISVILGKSNMARPQYPATRILYEPAMNELLEAIRVLMVRKSGPKKKTMAPTVDDAREERPMELSGTVG